MSSKVITYTILTVVNSLKLNRDCIAIQSRYGRDMITRLQLTNPVQYLQERNENSICMIQNSLLRQTKTIS